MQNRIRDLRKQKGLSQSELASRLGMGKWDVSRLETGATQLKLDVAQRVAEALGVTLAEVVGVANGASVTPGFSDDLVPYETSASDPFAGLAGGNRYLLQATSDSLDLAGIGAGDVLVADGSAEACRKIAPLTAVRVQYHPDPNDPMHAVTLLRQYLPPRLLVTNSSKENAPAIDMAKEDAQILAVIVSVHRKLG